MHSVCRCSLPVWRRSFLKKGTPRDLFWPRPGSAPGEIWPKNNNTCKGPWVLHPYQVSSKSIKRFWRRSWKCESLQTDDDGRTDDGRCAMTIAHLSLWLRWANKQSINSSALKHGMVRSLVTILYSDYLHMTNLCIDEMVLFRTLTKIDTDENKAIYSIFSKHSGSIPRNACVACET